MALDGALPVCALEAYAGAQVSHARRGDVVLLRFNRPMRTEDFERANAQAKRLTAKTGVTFVFLDESVDVVSAAPEDAS